MAHEVLKYINLNSAIVCIDDTIIYGGDVKGFQGILDQMLSQMAKFSAQLNPSTRFLNDLN